jgi:ATP-dependent helicase HrpA
MIKDRRRLRQALSRDAASDGQGRSDAVAAQLARSTAYAEARQAALPVPTFPENLPVSQRLDDIKAALASHQVVIIAGETGSGKTTQLPKICLALGRGVHGMIGHTQPRRVAARTVGNRIADELHVKFGEQVGYQVRFTDQTSPVTLVKVMTDGILLAETARDRLLEAYDTIIIDEAHERSLNIDFLLGYLKGILPKRPDLKVIVTSATIDVQRFSQHFSDAPVIEVSGRTFPVVVHYRPTLMETKSQDADETMYQGVLDTLQEIEQLERKRQSPGDVLVFLSGEREIRELAQLLRKAELRLWEVLPLYSRLSVAEQNRVFQAHRGRRIVLATNVAETSLTVPGIRYVIDTGLARISRYSVRSKIQQLPIEPISRASADQRKGRCGRISDGVCFRLYAEEDFLSRPEFTAPEILRTNLAAVILQMLTLKLGDISHFPFLEKPDKRQINDGFHLLQELQAVDDGRQINRMGREMARFPLDLRLSRMLMQASRTGCMTEVLTIVSGLAMQDPRDRPHDQQQAADEKHRQFKDEQSDFMTLVNIWEFFEAQRQALTQNQLRKFCRQHFLNYLRMREWQENHRQLHLVAKELKLKKNVEPADYATVHQALLAGLLGNIGERTDEKDYLGARNRRHFIFPGSGQFKRRPRWIMSAELVETTRLFGRTVAQIESEWIEPLAGHLVKRNYAEAYFDIKRGQVVAFEEVMLYGVAVIKKRLVSYGPVDPVRARHIFIQEALVEQQMDSKAGFYRHNCQLVAEIEKLESMSRKRDILVDAYTIFRFYDALLPETIAGAVDLDTWRKQIEMTSPKLLYLDKPTLMKQEPGLSEALYPNQIEIAETRLKLDYHFDPQHEDDGVSVKVPVALLRQVSRAQLDWVIPGLLREKCLALIKSLPKAIRKRFVPAPEYVDKVLPSLVYDGRDLTEVLAEKLFRLNGMRVNASDFTPDNLDQHLKMNIKVINDKGQLIGSARDLDQLQLEFAAQTDKDFNQRSRHELEVEGAVDWQFGELPAVIKITQADITLKGYPTLVDNQDSVAVKILDNPIESVRVSKLGLQRLIMLSLVEQVKYVSRNLPGFKQFSLYYATRGSGEALLEHLVTAVFRFTFIEDKPPVMSEAAFTSRLTQRSELVTVMNLTGRLMGEILKLANEIERKLAEGETPINRTSRQDLIEQLAELLAPGFLARVSLHWLKQYPRFLQAMLYRLDKMSFSIDKDQVAMAQVRSHWQNLHAGGGAMNESLHQYRWMIEEFRVSVFAQTLGTSLPVSIKRLEKEWQKSAPR